MMRIPLIFRHPRIIQAGSRCDLMVSNYDFLPTVLNYLGLGKALEGARPVSPGRDFSPALRGQSKPWDDVVYYEMETVRAIRTDAWKYVHRPEGPLELYDLAHDPYEKFNLYGQPDRADVQQGLRQRLEEFFARTADPKYDLYRGGGSKSSLLSRRASPAR